MLDRDLAELYNVTTGNLNKAVKRNLLRFPDDFMFQLTEKEFKNLIFQNGTSGWGGTRKLPYAFTEQGVAMLSSVLNSERAVLVNIHIIRVFTRMREMLSTHKDVLLKLEQLERKVVKQDDDIKLIFDYLKELLSPKTEPIRKIGFKHSKED
ncbi:MAG: ORF6N domain-containing protein [Cyclobacteriaceae bacterium]|nr:ORF6N domain-containing protein [Cyclobacteriaceae bacterium]